MIFSKINKGLVVETTKPLLIKKGESKTRSTPRRTGLPHLKTIASLSLYGYENWYRGKVSAGGTYSEL